MSFSNFIELLDKLLEILTWSFVALVAIICLRKELKILIEDLSKREAQGSGIKTPFLTLEARQQVEIGRDFLSLFESSEYIIIDSTELLDAKGQRFSISVSENMPVWIFLHKVRIRLEPEVKPYTYTKAWLLFSLHKNMVFRDIGINRPRTTGDKFDSRTLKEVGIYESGELKAELQVVPPDYKSNP
jgi:hypothetical protein